MLYFIETQFIRFQIWIYGNLSRFWIRCRQIIVLSLLIGAECLAIFLLFDYYDQFSQFLFHQLSEDLLHQLLIAIGALLASAIVFVFGLGQFVLQQTLEKNTVFAAEKIRKNPYFRRAFFTLCLLAMTCFLLTVVPVRQNTIISISFILFMILVLSFGIWWAVFDFSSKLANPSNQIIELYYKRSQKYLRKLPKYIDDFIRIGGIKNKDGTRIEKGDKATVGVVFEKAPEFSQTLEGDLSEIFEITKNFAHQKRLDVVTVGLNCIAKLVIQYLQIRKDSLMDFTGAGFLAGDIPMTKSSRFLESIHERFGVLSAIALGNNDKEMFNEVLAKQFSVVYATTQVTSLPISRYENPVAELAIYYFYEDSINKALQKEFYDVGLKAGNYLFRIGASLVNQQNYFTVLAVQTRLNSLGMTGIEKKQWYIVHEALLGISVVLTHACMEQPFVAEQILDESIEHIQSLVSGYLVFLQTGGAKGTHELSRTMDSIFGGDKETSIVNLFFALSNKVNSSDKSLADKYGSLFYKLSEKISEGFFDKLIPLLSDDTFLLWHIGSNIRSILLIYLKLLSSENLLDKEQLENDASWLLSFFRKLYKQKSIPMSRTREFQEILATTAMGAIDIERTKLLNAAISSIKCLAEETLAKDEKAYWKAPRMAVYLAYVALYAKKKNHQPIVEEIIEFLVEFQKKYDAKFPPHPGVINRTIALELHEFKRKGHTPYRDLPGFNDTQSKLATNLSYDEIESYIKYLVDTIQPKEEPKL